MKALNINQDGIKLYGYNNDIIYFDDWLKEISDWKASQESIRNKMLCNYGYSTDMVDEKMEELEEEFYEYCSMYDYCGETI